MQRFSEHRLLVEAARTLLHVRREHLAQNHLVLTCLAVSEVAVKNLGNPRSFVCLPKVTQRDDSLEPFGWAELLVFETLVSHLLTEISTVDGEQHA